ncbi:hypothetical protein [Pseudomonas sp. H3(2019)]|uniref:hypothetical protein n=1 Tax=Pseudomonas sp. H3(2019) TaxID=2598724 RepID=UPI002114D3D0|nr:hypothetical protein [Pseudomonas sp. H3(2019)]
MHDRTHLADVWMAAFSDSIKGEGMKHSLKCTLSGFGLALALTSVGVLAQAPTQMATQVRALEACGQSADDRVKSD